MMAERMAEAGARLALAALDGLEWLGRRTVRAARSGVLTRVFLAG